MRELWLMARGAWDHTAQIKWMMAEQGRDSDKRPQPYHPADFHPMLKSPKKVSNVMPYDPAVLEALQNSGKVRG